MFLLDSIVKIWDESIAWGFISIGLWVLLLCGIYEHAVRESKADENLWVRLAQVVIGFMLIPLSLSQFHGDSFLLGSLPFALAAGLLAASKYKFRRWMSRITLLQIGCSGFGIVIIGGVMDMPG